MQIALVILEKFLLKVTYQKQMEHSTRENQRYYIFVEWKNGSTAAEIHQKLVVAEGDQALSLRTIHCWIEAFELGKQSVKDEARSDEAVTPATIGKVEDFVSEDRHITTRKLSEEVGISDERIIYILHNELGLRKLCKKWVPHVLTNENKRK
jgi:histone-lysine N-methyltransferase SETMAR